MEALTDFAEESEFVVPWQLPRSTVPTGGAVVHARSRCAGSRLDPSAEEPAGQAAAGSVTREP